MRFYLRLFLVLCGAVLAMGFGQEGWEMRVCADPDNLPMSNQSEEGYDNKIAKILAEEMQAQLTYVWTPINEDTIMRYVKTGECDLVLGVADGVAGLLSTVPYYRIPYVFAYRQDSPFEVKSLDDSSLKKLTISTYPNGGPYRALLARNLNDNIVIPQALGKTNGPDYNTPILEGVLAKTYDLAILFGAETGYFAKQHPELRLEPVSPEIEPPLLQMFRIGTMAVRPGDEAFRDRLNIALAKHWDEIQVVFQNFNIPLQEIPRPAEPRAAELEPFKVGVVVPIPSLNPALTDVSAKAAQLASRMAEDLVGRESSLRLKVLLASSPTPEAAKRAAERLFQTEQIRVLVGGIGAGQAELLGKTTHQAGGVFFNIGSSDDVLRHEACLASSFHIEASNAMYLDALAYGLMTEAAQTIALVYDDTELGKALFERAQEAITKVGGQLSAIAVKAKQYTYNTEIALLKDANPDAILMLLSAEDQEFFLAAYAQSGLELPISGFPEQLSQTRDFLFRLQQSALTVSQLRLGLWETTLTADGADELNDRFMSRNGEPLDPSGWAAYAAIKIAFEATQAAESSSAAKLIAFLESPEAVFSVHKGTPVSFRPWDHQLSQTLYLLRLDPDAQWALTLSNRLEVADLVATLPEDSTSLEGLERLGDGLNESACQFESP